MPEVSEVAHICAQLRRNIIGCKVKHAVFPKDQLLFPQLAKEEPLYSNDELRDLVINRTVQSVGRHGKYLWLKLVSYKKPPSILLAHMGMTGNIVLKGIDSHMIMMENGGDLKVKNEQKGTVTRKKLIKKSLPETDLLLVMNADGKTLVGYRVTRDTILTLDNSSLREVKVEDIVLMEIDPKKRRKLDSSKADLKVTKTAKKEKYIQGNIEYSDPNMSSGSEEIEEDVLTQEPEQENEGKLEATNEGHLETSRNGNGDLKETNDGYLQDGDWPPKFTKFQLVLASSDDNKREINLAMTDPRRLGRVRVYTGSVYENDETIMKLKPLENLGPDYSKDPMAKIPVGQVFVTGDPDPDTHGRQRLGFRAFSQLVLSKKRTIKAILLQQELFAGIGNWVADEILYQSRIHPCETLWKTIHDHDHEVMKRLYDSMIYVMEFAVNVEGNVREFPEDWLMLHRWGKSRKSVKATTKAGHEIKYETVGGRTSSYVPELQKRL